MLISTTEVQKAAQCQSSASEYYYHVILQRKNNFGRAKLVFIFKAEDV